MRTLEADVEARLQQPDWPGIERALRGHMVGRPEAEQVAAVTYLHDQVLAHLADQVRVERRRRR